MFEYKIVIIEANKSKEDMEKELNKYGSEGWELLTLESFSKTGATQIFFHASITSGFVAIFKKEIK